MDENRYYDPCSVCKWEVMLAENKKARVRWALEKVVNLE